MRENRQYGSEGGRDQRWIEIDRVDGGTRSIFKSRQGSAGITQQQIQRRNAGWALFARPHKRQPCQAAIHGWVPSISATSAFNALECRCDVLSKAITRRKTHV
jgi:hypothetical protein